MLELILIRHGETEMNRAERLQGGQDSPLTERGADEARRLGAAMREFCGPIHQWYVSPQGRARQTSAILRSALEARSVDRTLPETDIPPETVHEKIVEIRCGDWEGLKRAEIPPQELRRVHLSANVPYPNGESFADVSARCESFLADWKRTLAADNAHPQAVHRTVLVSHGNLIRCMGGVLAGMGAPFAIRAIVHNTAVCRFFSREHPPRDCFFRMLSWNDRSHLSGGDPFFSL